MKRFKDLLVVAGHDSMATVSLLLTAADLAKRNDARITVLAVVDETTGRRSIRKRKATGSALRNTTVRTRLEQLRELAGTVDREIDCQVSAGVTHLEVLERVAVYGHDLVLVAEAGMRSWPLRAKTSTTMQLLRKCPVPVWVQAPTTATSDAIAVAIGPVGVDAATEALNVKLLELAGSMAKIQDSRLHVLHAWRLDGDSMLSSRRLSYPWLEMETLAMQVVTEARAELDWLIDRAGLNRSELSLHIRNGHTVDVLTAAIRDINPNTIVMGTVARVGVPGLIVGNTAERVLGAVDRSILAVKPDGFKVPAKPDIEWDQAMLPY